MSSNDATPGWHPDPANPAGSLRWWDGVRWTDETKPLQFATAPSGNRVAPAVPFAHRNQRSLTAIGFAALYVVVAVATHVVFFGIIPAMAAVRAFQRKEPLAPVAAVAAGLAVVIAVAGLTGH
jgi:hypothetical protein